MPAWRDTTSYSRDERGKSEPRTWEWQPDGIAIRLVVTRHIHSPGHWFILCEAVGINSHQEINSSSADESKAEALKLFATLARHRARMLNSAATQAAEFAARPSTPETGGHRG